MKSYYNNNDRFGDSGPFEAESAESLADGMMDTFKIWANEHFLKGKIEFGDIDAEIASMRDEFIKGLEEVGTQNCLLIDKNLGLIILDNGGGITLQMGGFAHYYEDADQAANDIANWLHNEDTSDWAGHEVEAAELNPTDEEISNGGYRRFRLDRDVDTLIRLAREVGACHWGNAQDLYAALRSIWERETMHNETNSAQYTFLG